MSYIAFRVASVRDYCGGAENKLGTFVRVDHFLCVNRDEQWVDSTVYSLAEFKVVHEIYVKTFGPAENVLYDSSAWSKYQVDLKKQVQRLMEDMK